MKLLFLIATCERPEMLSHLVRQIRAQCPVPSKICVLDDASRKDYNTVRREIEAGGGWYCRQGFRQGKRGYWRTVSRLFQRAKEEDFTFAFKLDDDITLHPQAIEKSLEIMEYLADRHRKVALNIWVDHRADETIWTDISPELIRFPSHVLRRVGWIDGGNWVANWAVFKALNWLCPRPPEKWWDRKGGDSSGVGKYLSLEFSRKACRIYMPTESFVYHGGHQSVMHAYKTGERPIEMKKVPWE